MRIHALVPSLFVSVRPLSVGTPNIPSFLPFFQRQALLIASVVLVLLNFCFFHYGKHLPGVPDPVEVHESSISVKQIIARLAAIGMVILAVLSGYGTVRMPFDWLHAFIRPVTEGQLESMAGQVVQLAAIIQHKEEEAVSLKQKHAQSDTSYGTSWWGSMFGSVIGQGATALKVKRLEVEIKMLSNLRSTVNQEYRELQAERKRVLQSKTWTGRLRNILGYIFAAYCVYRAFSALLTLFTQDPGQGDPVGFLASLMVSVLSGGRVRIDRKLVSQYVGLAFIGIVTANSLKNFLKDVLRVATFMSDLLDPAIQTLLFTEILVMYVCGALLMIRQKMPSKHREIITKALGSDLAFMPFNRIFNGLFLVVALITAYVLYKNHQAKRDGDRWANVADVDLRLGGGLAAGGVVNSSGNGTRNHHSISSSPGTYLLPDQATLYQRFGSNSFLDSPDDGGGRLDADGWKMV